MDYLLDSNVISDFYDLKSLGHSRIAECFRRLPHSSRVSVSILSLYEFEYGYSNAPEPLRPVIRAKISDIEHDFELLPLSVKGAHYFGELKLLLKKGRQLNHEAIKKHNIDLMLAAEALAHQMVLVSDDGLYSEIRELKPAFKWENWLDVDNRQSLTYLFNR